MLTSIQRRAAQRLSHTRFSCAALAGLAIGLGAVSVAVPAAASTEALLHVFSGGADGSHPYSGLTTDAAGNFYGTTKNGGQYNAGTVFKLSPDGQGGWTHTVIYSLTGRTDGALPQGKLAFDSKGNLYGTCIQDSIVGNGAIFELSPNKKGKWHLRRSFLLDRNGPDGDDGIGATPMAGVVVDAKGNVFGAAHYGGQGNVGKGYGTLFELSPTKDRTWTAQALHRFTSDTDGGFPDGELAAGKNGAYYGLVPKGGPSFAGYIFELKKTKDGWVKTDIHDFNNDVDGQLTNSALAIDEAGNLYGTLNQLVWPQASGIVFKLSPPAKGAKTKRQWTETTLYQFPFGIGLADGLTLDPAGNLLGYSSDAADGVLFQLTPTQSGPRTETDLYEFQGGTDAANPFHPPVVGSDGLLYGTSIYGGDGNGGLGDGTVFSISR